MASCGTGINEHKERKFKKITKKDLKKADRQCNIYREHKNRGVAHCSCACFGQYNRPLPVAERGRLYWRSGQNSAKRIASEEFWEPQGGGEAEDVADIMIIKKQKKKTI